jgi:hypothetical protein
MSATNCSRPTRAAFGGCELADVAANCVNAFSYGYDKLCFIRPTFIGDTIYTGPRWRTTRSPIRIDGERALCRQGAPRIGEPAAEPRAEFGAYTRFTSRRADCAAALS